MKYHIEKFHRSLRYSLRSNERPSKEVGDPIPVKRDMRAEQEAAFQPPGKPDPRVKEGEADQGRH